MFLEYGLDEHGEWVHIECAPRGLCDLACPYCGGPLIARKGQKMGHHFAHHGETCREVATRDQNALRLPVYDRFTVHISPSTTAALVMIE